MGNIFHWTVDNEHSAGDMAKVTISYYEHGTYATVEDLNCYAVNF